MEYVAKIVNETEKAYRVEPRNFAFDKDLDKFIPKSAVKNGKVDKWVCDARGLDGPLSLLKQNNGNNGGGATITNDNVLSTPVNVENEDGELDKLASEVEAEFDIDEEKNKEKKDAFGARAAAEENKIKQEQGLANTEEAEKTSFEKIEEEEMKMRAITMKYAIREAREIVEDELTTLGITTGQIVGLSKDLGITMFINRTRGGY